MRNYLQKCTTSKVIYPQVIKIHFLIKKKIITICLIWCLCCMWASGACVGLYGLSAAVCVCTHQCRAHTPPDPHHHWDIRLMPPAGHLSSEREYRYRWFIFPSLEADSIYSDFSAPFSASNLKLWLLSYLPSFLQSPVLLSYLVTHAPGVVFIKVNSFQPFSH